MLNYSVAELRYNIFFQTYHNFIFYEHITIENLLPLMKLYI